jgi:hypothetical protein
VGAQARPLQGSAARAQHAIDPRRLPGPCCRRSEPPARMLCSGKRRTFTQTSFTSSPPSAWQRAWGSGKQRCGAALGAGVVWCGVVWCACHAAQLAGGTRLHSCQQRRAVPSRAEPCRAVPCSLSPLSTPELPAPCTPHFLPLPSLPLLPSLLLRPVPSPRLPLAGFLWPRPSFMMPTYSMEHQAPGRACTTFRVRVGTANAAAGLSAGLPAAPVVFAARRCWPTIDSCDVAPILPCVLQPTAWLPGSAKRWGAARWLGWTKSCGSR